MIGRTETILRKRIWQSVVYSNHESLLMLPVLALCFFTFIASRSD